MPRTQKSFKEHLEIKRKLRRQATRAERLLWSKLKTKQFLGLKFRQQHGIGSYIVDFFCPEKRLVIEIDGDVHAFEEQKQKDKTRENYLKSLGLKIVRYQNDHVLKSIDIVLEDLYQKLQTLPPPDPLLVAPQVRKQQKEGDQGALPPPKSLSPFVAPSERLESKGRWSGGRENSTSPLYLPPAPALQRRRKKESGQTIIEFMSVTLGITGFFVLAYYLFSTFEIAQKQTMLARTQAFIELGNYSDYSQSKHGEDKVDQSQSRLTFALGEKTQYTRVDLQKIDSFKKAVEGEMTIDVTRAIRDDEFWNNFNFPKNKTTLVWLEGESDIPVVEVNLQQLIHIAHNRSLKLDQDISFRSAPATGLYSGSMKMKQYSALSDLDLPSDKALKDNLDNLKEILQEIVRNDPSLSDEAEALERTINASDSLAGGAQAALISMAIQMAMQFAMAELKELAKVQGAAGSAGGTAGSATDAAQTAGEGGFKGAFNQLKTSLGFGGDTSQMAQNATQNFAAGDLVKAPITAFRQTFIKPFSLNSGMGIDLLGKGAINTATGLSQVMQPVGIAVGMGGVAMPQEYALTQASLSFPGAFRNGYETFQGGTDATNAGGHMDWGTAAKGLSEMTAATTGLVSVAAPALAMPMTLINAGMGAIQTVGAVGSAVKDLGNASLDTVKSGIETVRDVGNLSVAVGGLYQSVATLAGEDGAPGAMLALAGSGLQAGAAIGEFAYKHKLSLLNPKDIGEGLVLLGKENINNGREALTELGQDLKSIPGAAQDATARLFDYGSEFKGDNRMDAKALASSAKEFDDVTSNDILRTSGSLNETNLNTIATRLEERRQDIEIAYKYNGQDPTPVLAEMDKAIEGVRYLQNYEEGETFNAELVRNATKAANEANKLIAQFDQSNKYGINTVKTLDAGLPTVAKDAVRAGLTKDDIARIDKDAANKHLGAALRYTFQGSRGEEKIYQQEEARQLAIIAKAQQQFEAEKKQYAQALAITRKAEGISDVVVVQDPQQLVTASQTLREVAAKPTTPKHIQERMLYQAERLAFMADNPRSTITYKEFLKNIKEAIANKQNQYDYMRCSLQGTC